MINNIIDQLKRDEGCELEAYPDALSPLGMKCSALGLPLREYRKVAKHESIDGSPWSIAYGHTGGVKKGDKITQAQAEELLKNDAKNATDKVKHSIPWSVSLDDARFGVLVNMCFNMGINGLLKFINTLKHLKEGNYDLAADNLLKSVYANQVKNRANRLATQLRTGKWV